MSADLLQRAQALRAELAAVDPALYSGTDAMVVAETLALTEKACAAARTRFAARAAQTAAPRIKGFTDSADWLAKVSGETPGQARAGIELAEALEAMPATRWRTAGPPAWRTSITLTAGQAKRACHGCLLPCRGDRHWGAGDRGQGRGPAQPRRR